MSSRKIRVGSRRSALAVVQAKSVMDSVQAAHPELELELVTMETTGDVNMKAFSGPSDRKGIKGLFTLELEQALLKGELDLVVHSLKDLSMDQDPRLPLVAYSRREDPRDALLLPRPSSGDPQPGSIGCSSARRRLQLAEIFPDRIVAPLRGNVQTRLSKLDEGRHAMLVLAAAGLKRLKMEERIDWYFSPDEIVPAAGQGILACQGRLDEDYGFLDSVRDRDAEICARAERSFVAALNGGCSSPVAAYAQVLGDRLELLGFYADDEDAFLSVRGRKGKLSGVPEDAEKLGRELAFKLKGK